jgi:hypothetical protein
MQTSWKKSNEMDKAPGLYRVGFSSIPAGCIGNPDPAAWTRVAD